MKGLTSLTSLSPISFTCYYHSKPKSQRFLQVRSQSFKDEGSSSNIVDANLDVLRARMEQLMKSEKLENTTNKQTQNIGWKYAPINAPEHDTHDMNSYAAMMTETMKVVGLVGGSFGLVFLFGSLLILVVSLLVHLCT